MKEGQGPGETPVLAFCGFAKKIVGRIMGI